MKKNKKLLLAALSATLVMSASSAVALTAFADTATKDHEFSGKYDAVFEDFDRADISNTVKTEGTGVKTGEKPYLHVEYTGKSTTPADAIYKQGSGSIANVKDGGTITLEMRAPKNDVDLSEIMFGIRGVDSDAAVFAKPLSDLTDSGGESLPDITDEWRTFEISFATSYEKTDVYPTSTDAVTDTPLLAIHIYAASESDTGTLDIASVKYSTTGSNLMNDFIGGTTVQDTAKNADSGTWWAGSSEGYIVKRAVNMTSGSFTVVKDSAVGKYAYAVIEADGDIAHLKVATTENGTAWGDAAAYDGYSVKLNGNEKGFKFTYDGEDENGVTIKRIYLTNVVVPEPAIAVPVIDASTVDVLEDFAVAQKNFTNVWEDMSTAPELAEADLEYRISYNNGDKVEVKDGSLVFDATDLGDGFINFKFKAKSPVKGNYIVMKVKGEDGANLDAFRFALGNSEDVLGDVVWTNQMKAGIDLPVALLDDSNPYKTSDGWYYVVVDLEESGFRIFDGGYSIMDIYYGGSGKLSIDNIFFCNKIDVKVPNVEKDLAYPDAKIDVDATTSYVYRYMYVLNEGYGTTLEFDITPKEDNFDISNWRVEFQEKDGLPAIKTLWGGENADGSMITTDGKKLNELTYEKDKATHVVVDLAKSGIDAKFMNLHCHVDNIGGFTVTNVKLHTSTPANLVKDLDTEKAHVVKEDDGTTNKVVTIAPVAGYFYAGYVGSLTGLTGQFSMDITVADSADLANLRLEFTSGKTLWASENEQGILYTADGKMLSEVEFEAGVKKTVVIDLEKSGATLSDFHIHMGDSNGAITIENITVTPYIDYVGSVFAPKYAEEMSKLVLTKDNVAPKVSITTATTAKAGDEITIAYTASDNVTAKDDLKVTVTVTKDGEAVAVKDNKFTAEEGVYTVTVTVRDANGNEESDTIQITVSAKGGLSTGAIAGIAVGCVAAVVVAGVAVYFVMKKKKNN
ncbi:MAG: hypothetical protein K2N23_02515 [Clostridia bacterium]|nr:hypothetical protein [Clostridia bacterium]